MDTQPTMATAFHPSTVSVVAVMLPLVLWRMYRRFRRLVGRQRTGRYRPWISIGIYGLILAAVLYALWGQWPALQALGAGVLAGVALSRWAWRRTQLEVTAQGLYYTPHTYLGIGLFLLLVARVAYRVVEVVWLLPPEQAGMHHFVASPLTLSVLGLMAGHTLGFAVALVLWRRQVLAARDARRAQQAAPSGQE